MDVTFTINHKTITVPDTYTILTAAKQVGINIPTLCHLDLHDMKCINGAASCRVCLVEIEGEKYLQPACSTYVREGMNVMTSSRRAVRARRAMLELLLSNHPNNCLICEKNMHCVLQKLTSDMGIKRGIKYNGEMSINEQDASSQAIIRNPTKCIMCRRCETMCNEVQTCGILTAVGRGFKTIVAPAFNMPLADSMCTYCGQCVAVCPTAALTEVSNIGGVWDALNDPDKVVLVQTAPSIRVALGEEFGMEVGTDVTGKMVASLRALGFDKVFDTNYAADLTVMEEAEEFIQRLQGGGKLPMLTSCCPAWVKFIEHQFPALLDVPSSCKSPHEMFGAIAKTYYAEKNGIDPEKIVVVSIMPCLAKKYEARRAELESEDHLADVDYVLTTRELASMLREAGVDFPNLEEEDFDPLLGESSGAGTIFGTSGGVIEAVMRTACEKITGEPLRQVEFKQLRGMEGIREAEIMIGDKPFKIGMAFGLGNARKLLESIERGEAQYQAIEIMACPGGCIGGGGQPYYQNSYDVLQKRRAAIYANDEQKAIRKAHENPEIIKLYDEFLGAPGSERAHKLLHTKYVPREMI